VQHALAVMLIRQDGHIPVDPRQGPHAGSGDRPSAGKGPPRASPPANSGQRPPLLQITLADGTRLTQDNVGPGVLGTAAKPDEP